MKNQDSERRKHIRVGRSLLISYKMIDAGRGHEESATRNISGGGMKIPFKQKPHAGSLLQLELELLAEKKKIKLEGKIAWVKSCADERSYPYEAGVEFIHISSATRTMLSNCVQYLSRYELLKEGGQGV